MRSSREMNGQSAVQPYVMMQDAFMAHNHRTICNEAYCDDADMHLYNTLPQPTCTRSNKETSEQSAVKPHVIMQDTFVVR